MNHQTYSLLFSLIALALCSVSCNDNDDFRVLGTIENLGTQNLRVAYSNEASVVMLTTTAIDGKFSFTGKAPKETMLEIFTTDRAPLGVMVVKNGQSLDVKIDRSDIYNVTIKGNKASEEISAFMRDNATTLSSGTPNQVNALIASYIGAHPRSMASTVLLLREFHIYRHEAEADSLFRLIDHKARPDYMVGGITAIIESQLKYSLNQPVENMNLFTEGDSVMAFNPARSKASLLTFTRLSMERSDSLTSALRDLARRYKSRQLQIIDISLLKDTAEWHKAISGDSARWIHAWTPGGVAAQSLSQLRLPRIPYYIVADSTGKQIYRGESMTEAATAASTVADSR